MENSNERREMLFYKAKNGYDRISDAEKKAVVDYAEEYKKFLDNSRTEREAVMYSVELAEKQGFKPYSAGMKLKAGDKVYVVNHAKSLYLAVIGKEDMKNGVHITAAHIDSPRLDLKPMPVYEDRKELVYLKTHYYGGIKKYQWTAIPLELHGVIALCDGGIVNVNIGSDPSDPVFTITDLLPHLAGKQMSEKLSTGISGESLNALIGSIPDSEEGSDRAKFAILNMLYEKYGVTEADFLSAELTLTPNFPTRDIGLDRSLLGGYGHDDRCCAFGCLKGIFNLGIPTKTAICVLADKEEVGSTGNTGMRSHAFDTFISDLCGGDCAARRCYENSSCLSADVCNAFDPIYGNVSEPMNSAYANYGVGIMKYTGSRGKSGCNDANAEYVGIVRNMLDKAEVVWQMAELGKVDEGGGGTVAAYMSERNIDTIDIGVPVLSMHAPYEVISKLDLYMAGKAMGAFCAMEE